MNWVLGIIGAFVGAGLSESRWLLGAVFGFAIAWLLMSLLELRRRVDAQDRELQDLHIRSRTPAPAPAFRAPIPDVVPTPAAASAPIVPETPIAAPGAEAAAVSPMPPPMPSPQREPPPIPANYRAASTSEPLPPGMDEASIAAARARFAERNGAAATADTDAKSPSPSFSSARVRAPREPGWDEKFIARVKSWFTEGNVPVKIGVLVLLPGVAALLRYAAELGYFTFPVEYRFIGVAIASIVALAFGFRVRESRPAFGLSLQGGAIGILLLTVFAAYSPYQFLLPNQAFGLIVVLVAGAALLSVLQKNMPLAALGFLGGYLAPVLINSGSNNYVGLFSYYAVLNAAVFAISWKQSWRLLNLIGFAFTFGVGSVWGAKNYQPAMFATVEPFLILFFVFYVVIGLLYVIRQTEYRRPWVDGTLVFGTPLVAFPLQAMLLKDDKMSLAFSALVVALVYAGLVFYLRRRRDERLLTEAYGALALGFATLAIPLAFSAGTTATLWALEGAGVAWLGIRQKRTFPWLSGLLLQILAAGSYVIHLFNDDHGYLVANNLLLNAEWFGAVILAFSGYALSLIHDRHRPIRALSALLFLWATFWWIVAACTQLDAAEARMSLWTFSMGYLGASVAIAVVLRHVLGWLRLNWLLPLAALFGMGMVFYAQEEFGSPLNASALPMWLLFAAVMAAALRGAGNLAAENLASRSLAVAHVLGLWTIALAATMQLEHISDTQQLAQGWRFVADVAPVALMTLGLWRRPDLFAWPRAEVFAGYRIGWFGLAIPMLVLAFLVGLFLEGSAAPLPYLPLLNPLELGLLAIAAMLVLKLRDSGRDFSGVVRLWPVLGFVFITMTTLRAVHHWHGDPWSPEILASGFTQTSLTVIWSLLGVGSMLLGSQRRHRPLWIGGMVLMILVCGKLMLIDRGYMGNLPGIVSFLAVGLLLVGVGYFAPSPPKHAEESAA